jgi:methionyl-tRNA formyltransferase
MRVVFFGSDEFALPTLAALAGSQRHPLAGVVSQPDRPAGRGLHLHPTPVSQFALAHNLPLIRPKSVNQDEVRAELAKWAGQIGVVVAFGQKIGNAVLDMFAPHGCLNLHSSLLPRYRGAAPVARAIINGESETGLTIFRLVERMDAGPIVCQRPTQLHSLETAGEVTARLAIMGPDAMLDALDAIEQGRAVFQPQDDSLACPAPKLTKLDGVINWNQSAVVIANQIRGLYPWPGVHARYLGQSGRTEEVVLARAAPESATAQSQMGADVGVVRQDLAIAAGLGAVRIVEIKPASGRLMKFSDYVNGRRVRPGDRFLPRELPTLPAGKM